MGIRKVFLVSMYIGLGIVLFGELIGAQEKVPLLNSIIPEEGKLEKVTIGYVFDTAGSPLYVDGELYFTNNCRDPKERSHTVRMGKDGKYYVIRNNNGMTTTMQHSGKGTIYCCEMLGHRVVEMNKQGEVIHVMASEYNGKRIDGPNDLVVDKKGGVYFTDSQLIGNEQKIQETPAVYYIKSDGTVIRVIDDIALPNGIALSPNGKILYVANSYGRYLRAYDINPDGTVTHGRDCAEIELSPKAIAENSSKSNADGIKVDSAGNIFVATTDGIGIQVFNVDGKHIGNIPCPSITNNCNFGGEDLKTLYISAADGIYKMPLITPGLKMP